MIKFILNKILLGKQTKSISKHELYKIAIQARNFHYENFSKWMTYFYIAIGALFVGYYNMGNDPRFEILPLLLSVFGYIVSLLLYWCSKGYYYWNINFITLVNNYEKEILKIKEEESVYSVFANKERQNNYISPISGANISTSKVAILFAFLISVVWGIIVILETCRFYKSTIYDCSNIFIIIGIITISCIITIGLGFVPKNFLTSYIDHIPDLKLKQKPLDQE